MHGVKIRALVSKQDEQVINETASSNPTAHRLFIYFPLPNFYLDDYETSFSDEPR